MSLETDMMFPPGARAFVARLGAGAARVGAPWCVLGDVFSQNLVSVINTANLPFRLVAGAAARLRFQQLCFHEQERRGISSSKLAKRDVESITAVAREQFREKTRNSAEMVRDADWTLSELKKDASNPEYLQAYEDLLRQCLVMTWNSFEVLARDGFAALCERTPRRLSFLAQTNFARKRLGNTVCDKLEAEQHVDTEILVDRLNFNNLATIRTAFAGVAGSAGSPRAFPRLEARTIDVLYQRRHLIIHRRGVVDASYLQNTGEGAPIGATLVVKGADVVSALDSVADAGVELLEALEQSG